MQPKWQTESKMTDIYNKEADFTLPLHINNYSFSKASVTVVISQTSAGP